MKNKPILHDSEYKLNEYLSKVKRLFIDGAKITLVVRFPGDSTTDSLTSDDDLGEVIRLIERFKSLT